MKKHTIILYLRVMNQAGNRTLYLLYCTKRNVIVHYIYYTVLSNIHEKIYAEFVSLMHETHVKEVYSLI